MNTITNNEYWNEVAAIAVECRDQWDGETDWNEHSNDCVHETVDGHQWVIYTHYNFQVLQHSDNDDAFEESYIDFKSNWKAAMTYCAMRQDVMDYIGRNYEE